MRVGLSVYDIAACDLVELARAADEVGFDSLWLGEHVVAPVGYSSEHPAAATSAGQRRRGPIVDSATKLLDPLVALAGCATATSRISLATGVYLAGLRAPLVAARMVHTLHQLSEGRVILGVGSGWLEEEFEAVGVPFGGRARRLEETIEVMREAWSGGPFSHSGELFRTGRLQLCEQPIRVPVIMGGNSCAALERAARVGDGWFASGTPGFDDACRLRDRVCRLRDRVCRLRGTAGRGGSFPVYARVARADPVLVERYEATGWDSVLVWADQVWPAGGDLASKRAALAAAAQALGVAQPAPRP